MDDELNLDDMINKPYSKVTIELKENYNIEEIKNLLIRRHTIFGLLRILIRTNQMMQ